LEIGSFSARSCGTRRPLGARTKQVFDGGVAAEHGSNSPFTEGIFCGSRGRPRGCGGAFTVERAARLCNMGWCSSMGGGARSHFKRLRSRAPAAGGELSKAFEILFEAAPVSMLVVDAKGAITLLNSQAEAMFGYKRDELVGRAVEILVPPRLRSVHVDWRQQFVHDARRRTMGASGTLTCRRKDESEFPVEIGLSPFLLDGGTFVIATIIDVTLRKAAEERQRMFEYERATLATCQQLGLPAAVLQRDGRILFLNPLMGGLRSEIGDTGDRFELANPSENEQLLDVLANIDIEAGDPRPRSIAVHTGNDHSPLVFHLLAMRGPLGDALVVLVVTTVDAANIPSTDLVQRLFALAPAEARIAVLIGSGVSPRQAAKQLGISEGNVRTALKRIFAKIGVSRQSELAALLAKLRLH
jgi:PAS domain S-box-containing protein